MKLRDLGGGALLTVNMGSPRFIVCLETKTSEALVLERRGGPSGVSDLQLLSQAACPAVIFGGDRSARIDLDPSGELSPADDRRFREERGC